MANILCDNQCIQISDAKFCRPFEGAEVPKICFKRIQIDWLLKSDPKSVNIFWTVLYTNQQTNQ